MQLKLKNIGMIKEADVNIDGLTVIAGENDTGKSTVGKALFSIFQNKDFFWEMDEIKKKNEFQNIFYNVLKFRLDENSEIRWIRNDDIEIEFSKNNTLFKNFRQHVIFIETPIITNLFEFFSRLDTAQNEVEYVITDYPYIFRKLYKQIKLPLKKQLQKKISENIDITIDINSIINGDFRVQNDKIEFEREGTNFNVNSVATGIKSFGILQILAQNNYLTNNTILILDEPEVHLHPKWQLKMAELIVSLVKNGVKVVVNSHSPYMIEALERYSEREKIVSDFYLAEAGIIGKVDDNNSKTLSKIFSKLSEPFDTFDEMDSKALQNG